MVEPTPGKWGALAPKKQGRHWHVGVAAPAVTEKLLPGIRPHKVKDGEEVIYLIAQIGNGAPGDTLETEETNAKLFASSKDHAIVLAAILSGRLRWEFFSGSDTRGELCINGIRHATRLDAFGCPILTDLARASLPTRLT